ncbi:MAG: endonuclease [Bacteroidales bacterium]|nr:endonuclease [Bacteroidales bacterium]
MKNPLLKKRVGILAVLFLILSQHAFSQTPPEDLSGENLKTWLRTNYYDGKHQTLGYTTARVYLYNYIDNENNVITCVYSDYEVNSPYGGTTTYPTPINCEHTIPQSFFNEADPMVSDIHHLFPTYENWNSTRSNYPLTEIDDNTTSKWMYLDQSQTSIPSSNIDLYSESASSVFEPRENHKGNAARAIFYFYTMYPTQAGDMSQVGDIDIFYQWHLDDPVDAEEIERNNEIETYQGNRNPFIDYPETVARAWELSPVNTPPVTPALQIDAGETSISLSWNNVSDENGYKLYKSSGSGYSLLTDLAANTTSYTDNSVSESITYSYYILAYNDYGNSSNSNTVSGQLNSGNTGSGISVSEALAESIGTSVTVDGIITESYNGVYALIMKDINGSETIVVKLETDHRDEWSPENNSSAVGKTIEVVGVRDTYSSEQSIEYVTCITEIGGNTEDTEAPTAPGSLVSSGVTETSVNLSWTSSTDNVGVTGYDIYRNGSYLASSSSTTYSVTGLTASTAYAFYVKAKDGAGNISGASNTLNATTSDIVVTYCSSQGNNSSYEWIANVEIGSYTNTSGAANYTDFTSENPTLEAGSSVSISLTPGFSGSTYYEYWKIWIDYNADGDFDDPGELAFDSGSMSKTTVSGNMSVSSTASGTTRMRISMKYNAAQTACEAFSYGEVEDYTVTFGAAAIDTEAPTTPTSLASGNVTSSSVTINWNASTDNVAVTEYEVYRNGSQIGTSASTSYSVSGLSSSTQYAFAVKAKDAAGNASALSNTLNVTTSDIQLSYCTTKGNNVYYEWIDLVTIGSINNITAANDGYADFTNLSTTVSAGENVSISVSCGFRSSSYTEYWHVWVDWNQNGTFDSNEEMATRSSSSSGTLTYNFTVPGDALAGSTRMRVTMKYASSASPCETFSYGEVEDYTIIVSAAKSASMYELSNSFASSINVKLYPNPANSYTILELIADDYTEISYKLVDIQGRIHILKDKVQVNGYQEERIDISNLNTGIYFIMITNNEINENYKLVVE